MTKTPSLQQTLRPLVVPVFVPSVLMSIAEYSLLPVIPASASLLGADLATAGLIAGLLMVGILVADLPAGRLVERIGERRAMIFGSGLGATGILLVAFGNNLWLMGIGVFLLGIGVAIFALARHAFFAEHIPLAYRARALSMLGGTFRAGAFIGPLIGSGIIYLFDVHGVYWFAGIVCAVSAIVLLRSPKDVIKPATEASTSSVWRIAKREAKSLATLGVGASILGAIRTTRQIGLPLWAIFIGLNPAETSFYIALAGILDFALFYTSGQIMDKYGRFWAAVPPTIGLGILHLFVFSATDGLSFLTLACAMALANGLGSGIILTMGADLAPSDARHEYLASYRLITDLGVAAASPALAAITAATSLATGMATFGVIGIAGGLLMWRYIPVLIPKSRPN
ncbi:MAG: MFS transporter [Rhodoluna sp.]